MAVMTKAATIMIMGGEVEVEGEERIIEGEIIIIRHIIINKITKQLVSMDIIVIIIMAEANIVRNTPPTNNIPIPIYPINRQKFSSSLTTLNQPI